MREHRGREERALIIERSGTDSLVHIRRRDTRECIGDIEAALYDIIRAEWEAEQQEKAAR